MVAIVFHDGSKALFDRVNDIGTFVIGMEEGFEDCFIPKEKVAYTEDMLKGPK